MTKQASLEISLLSEHPIFQNCEKQELFPPPPKLSSVWSFIRHITYPSDGSTYEDLNH